MPVLQILLGGSVLTAHTGTLLHLLFHFVEIQGHRRPLHESLLQWELLIHLEELLMATPTFKQQEQRRVWLSKYQREKRDGKGKPETINTSFAMFAILHKTGLGFMGISFGTY